MVYHNVRSIKMKPFLKWAGGKQKLVGELSGYFGPAKRLVEPFTGSGSIFMGTDYDEYLLCDINNDLITLYNNLKSNKDALLNEVDILFSGIYNTSTNFYELRTEFNDINDPIRKSALFVYLNKHAFNGLCRYNSKGKYNVPYGKYASPNNPIDNMIIFSEKAQKATFVCQGFEDTFKELKDGDVVYCDPPYVPLNKTSFTAYHTGDFSMYEHERLTDMAERSDNRVVISNIYNSETIALYKNAETHAIYARRSISGNAAARVKEKEIIAIYKESN